MIVAAASTRRTMTPVAHGRVRRVDVPRSAVNSRIQIDRVDGVQRRDESVCHPCLVNNNTGAIAATRQSMNS
jgi:hypothetical protein